MRSTRRVLLFVVAALSACTVEIDRSQFACSAGGICDREDAGSGGSRDGSSPADAAPDRPDARGDAGAIELDAARPLDATVSDGSTRDGSADAQARDAGAPRGAVCAVNSDCASTVCFDLGGMTGRRCVNTCGTENDCNAGETCYSLNGAKLCLSSMFFGGATFTTESGGSCSGSGQCRSNYCSASSCVGRCDVDADCAGGECAWHTFAGDELRYIAACDGPAGTIAIGGSCTDSADCRTGVCRDSTCVELCRSDVDCSSSATCAYLNYSECVQPDGTNCPDDVWIVNVVKACIAGEPGPGSVGAPCTDHSECRTLRCHPASGTCASACSTDADCPATHRCKIAETAVMLGDAGPRIHVDLCLPAGF